MGDCQCKDHTQDLHTALVLAHWKHSQMAALKRHPQVPEPAEKYTGIKFDALIAKSYAATIAGLIAAAVLIVVM